MRNKFKFLLFFLFVIAASSNYLEGVCLDSRSFSTQELIFETADPAMREFLVNFAIESNDIYQTRTASIEVARTVFEIPDSVFEKGTVQILKRSGEIVGFYTLKVHPPTDDWFEYELGHLFVKAGLQCQGLGTHLFNQAISVASSRGWKKLQWLCDPDAEIFYIKMGAKVTGQCENLLNPGVDLPVFEYNL